jgi:hypothetical protein
MRFGFPISRPQLKGAPIDAIVGGLCGTNKRRLLESFSFGVDIHSAS